MSGKCIHYGVCRRVTMYSECRDGTVVNHLPVGDVYEQCGDYTPVRTCCMLPVDEGHMRCSECGCEYDYHDSDSLPMEGENLVYDGRFCKNCGAGVVGE